jgi:hypothetical protein
MNFGEIIYSLPPFTRRIARKIESIWKKLINAEAVVVFNKICLEEDILTKYTDMYMEVTYYYVGKGRFRK